MRKIFSLLLVLGLAIISGCKEESENEDLITGAFEAGELRIIEELEEERIEESEDVTTVRLCHDTDNGIVRWVNGSVFGFYSNATRFEFNDYCQNFNYLMEFYCEDEYPKQQIFLCRNGCEEGHCN
ncbi:hypothetical protein KY347_06915 [Candidatus Woesearchaeota archaeon]|nr:hypothetical protein [Candidatus Woesearchaeota archaeon]